MYFIIFSKRSFESFQNIISTQNIVSFQSLIEKEWFAHIFKIKSDHLDPIVISDLRNKIQIQQSDLIIYQSEIFPLKPKMFVFDMDSTLIQEEVIDELARKHGVYKQVSEITERAMEGEFDFDTAFKLRCSLLKNLSVSSFAEVFSKLHLSEGAEDFLNFLKTKKIPIIVLSGGFNPVLQMFQEKYKINEYRANELEIVNHSITGNIIGDIINREKKQVYLIEYRKKFQIPKESVFAVGDGSNDKLMLQEAGIGIGFRPKNSLKKNIQSWLDFAPMNVLKMILE